MNLSNTSRKLRTIGMLMAVMIVSAESAAQAQYSRYGYSGRYLSLIHI